MKHIQPRTLQHPVAAQTGLGTVGKAIVNALLFGINPLLTVAFKSSGLGGDG